MSIPKKAFFKLQLNNSYKIFAKILFFLYFLHHEPERLHLIYEHLIVKVHLKVENLSLSF